jgi:hypothetical protein
MLVFIVAYDASGNILYSGDCDYAEFDMAKLTDLREVLGDRVSRITYDIHISTA